MPKFKMSFPVKLDELRVLINHLNVELNVLRKATATADVTPAQAQVLTELAQPGPHTVVSLTKQLGLDKSTISQTLSQLMKSGYIEMKENSADRRYKFVTLTSNGHKKLQNINDAFDTYLKSTLDPLQDKERNAIAYGLGIFAKALEEARVMGRSEVIPAANHTPARPISAPKAMPLGRGLEALLP